MLLDGFSVAGWGAHASISGNPSERRAAGTFCLVRAETKGHSDDGRDGQSSQVRELHAAMCLLGSWTESNSGPLPLTT